MDTQGLRNIVVTRVFDAPVESVWNCWVDPELVRQWWGPDHFTAPVVRIDFREGGKSLVCMRAPQDFGGQDSYNVWIYKKIVSLESIDFFTNFSDTDGNVIDPVSVGMPADFPKEFRTVVTFKQLDHGQTEMTVTQYGMPTADSQMGKFAEMGLNQSIDKMLAIPLNN